MTQPRVVDGLDRICRGLGGVTPGVALRSDGHGVSSGVWAGDGELRRGGQTLRGVGGDLPTPAGQPQGCGGEVQSHCGATMVANTGQMTVTVEAAQASLDEFCRRRGDTRLRTTADGKVPVGTLASQ